MKPTRSWSFALATTLLVAACSSSVGPVAPVLPPADTACAGPCPKSAIRHLVVIVQENHTFDDHFGRYCAAPPGSNPTCTDGPRCCEAAPAKDPAGNAAILLDDREHGGRDPDHSSACEVDEIDQGKMDRYATSTATASCGSVENVAYQDASTMKPYWDLASSGALADRYFQPVAGQSQANDMFFARAGFVFADNDEYPSTIGAGCNLHDKLVDHAETQLGDLLDGASVPWTFYAEGYQAMKDANGACPPRPSDCPFPLPFDPCAYDPGDVPFEFFPSVRGKHMKDFAALDADLTNGGLAAVSFVKLIGYHNEHPGHGTTATDGVAAATAVIAAIARSRYRADTLVLLTYDEGGGYFDHVAPPPANAFDGKPYGTRVPLLATGPFAKKGFVSHVTMEHSSIVKFVEWNWLAGTGQLGTRDTIVANLGSLLDANATNVAVPEQ